ncbi:hypothetical protein B0H16DRAFT_1469103 [Mycena metata]|uniref:Uncharacterized protein n=1 Tax=Mycena metata TaxID=1033252 RepID=A0AAD7MTP6_9AGAR|nr:hypothetical protein B0H16DRAFT_1469103 [Mycena metata]
MYGRPADAGPQFFTFFSPKLHQFIQSRGLVESEESVAQPSPTPACAGDVCATGRSTDGDNIDRPPQAVPGQTGAAEPLTKVLEGRLTCTQKRRRTRRRADENEKRTYGGRNKIVVSRLAGSKPAAVVALRTWRRFSVLPRHLSVGGQGVGGIGTSLSWSKAVVTRGTGAEERKGGGGGGRGGEGEGRKKEDGMGKGGRERTQRKGKYAPDFVPFDTISNVIAISLNTARAGAEQERAAEHGAVGSAVAGVDVGSGRRLAGGANVGGWPGAAAVDVRNDSVREGREVAGHVGVGGRVGVAREWDVGARRARWVLDAKGGVVGCGRVRAGCGDAAGRVRWAGCGRRAAVYGGCGRIWREVRSVVGGVWRCSSGEVRWVCVVDGGVRAGAVEQGAVVVVAVWEEGPGAVIPAVMGRLYSALSCRVRRRRCRSAEVRSKGNLAEWGRTQKRRKIDDVIENSRRGGAGAVFPSKRSKREISDRFGC